MKTLLLATLLCVCGFSQSQPVYFYAGSDLTYICQSKNQSIGPATSWSINGSTLTSIVVSSNVATITTVGAHQLYDGARFTVSGSTAGVVDGSFTVLSTPSTTTFTAGITAADATYNNAGLSLSTNSPLLNVSQWRIQVFYYEASVLKASRWESYDAFNVKCSDRALYK